MEENKNKTIKTEEPKKEEPKDELRGKFLSTFKIFDDEGPTVPVEITNVGKLDFNIEDLDPNKASKKEAQEVEENISIDIDLKDNLEDSSKKFVMNSKAKNEEDNKKDSSVILSASQDGVKILLPTVEDSQELKINEFNSSPKNENSQKHYKSSKFFSRFFITILDQSVVLLMTYVYFLFVIKPSMIELPYKYIEGITYFIINDKSSLTSLIVGYILIMFIYYTLFNIIMKSTPFSYLFGYKIYRNDKIASVGVLIFRNLLMIPLNFFLLFPYLFLIISDDKQTLYDKIFKTYLLKEN